MWSLFFDLVFQRGPQNRHMGWMNPYVLFFVLFAVLFIFMIMFLFFPRLERVRVTEPLQNTVEKGSTDDVGERVSPEKYVVRNETLEVAIRLLEPDERLIVEALMAKGGSILQKDISYELGFTRVKTHRTIVKLLRRGVVKAEKYHNTNRIELADWLRWEG